MNWLICLTLGVTSLAAANLQAAPSLSEIASLQAAARPFDAKGNRARPAVWGAFEEQLRGGSGSEPWQPIGLFGGDAQDIAVALSDPQIVLAGTDSANNIRGALYRSTDGGTHWTLVEALGSRSIFDIEATTNDTFYVGTSDGVWKSLDNGATWSQLNLGLAFVPAFAVKVDPATPSTVWAGMDDFLGTQPVNLLRSLDGGNSWSDLTPPLATPTACRSIAIHPMDSQRVYAAFAGGFSGGQMWVSSTAGSSWTDRSAGLPDHPIYAVEHDGNRVLVGGGHNLSNQSFGLFASIDDGANWTALHDGSWPILFIADFAIDPNDTNKILVASRGAGVFSSVDGGVTWTIGAQGTAGISALAVSFAPASSSRVFLGTSSDAVKQSLDGGATFADSSSGISEIDLTSLVADPGNPNRLAATFQGLNDGGVYTSIDGGSSWLREPVPPTRYSQARFAPDGTLYAISSGPSAIAPEGIYRREVNGSWTALGPDQGGLFETDLTDLAFSPTDPQVLVAIGSDFGVAGSEATIWRSADLGASWQKAYEAATSDGQVNDLEISTNGLDQVATYTEPFNNPPIVAGVLRSTDGGMSWLESSTGLPTPRNPMALCRVGHSPDNLILSDSGNSGIHPAIYTSSDSGQSWISTGFLLPRAGDLACDPVADQVIYLATTFGGPIWRSQDGGVSFTLFDGGLANVGRPIELTFDGSPTAPRLLLASSRGGFSYRDPAPIFADGFESGDLTLWSGNQP